jgi:predicted RND superfamily exporter protein
MMHQLFKRAIEGLVRRIVVPHHRSIVAVSLVVTTLSAWVIVSQWNINSNLRVLLPEHSQAAQSMRRVDARVGSSTSLFVVVDSPDMEANKEFARAYAQQLRELPSVALAHFHNDKQFFEDHQLLYLDEETLADLRRHVDSEIEEAKKKANPLFVSLDDESGDSTESEGGTSVEDLRERSDDMAHAEHPEYFTSPDGYSLTIMVRFSQSSSDLTATHRLLEKIRQLGQSLEPTDYHSDMTLAYGGGLIDRKNKYRSILGDLKGSALFTILGLFALLGLYFRRIRAVALVLLPLSMGVVWTLAGAFLWFGELNTISAFIFAILLGLGIDFSIHLLSGYDHARIDGLEPEEALVETYQGTGRATLIGASTTFMTFGVVGFAQFRGLSQFGQMASAGVLLSIIAMFLVLPSLILTIQGWVPHRPVRGVGHTTEESGWFRTSIVERTTPVALGVIVVLTTLAAIQIPNVGFEEKFDAFGQFTWPWTRWVAQEEKPDPAERARDDGKTIGGHVANVTVDVREQMEPESFQPERRQTTTKAKYSSAVNLKYSSAPTVLVFDSAEAARTVYRLMNERKEAGKLDTIRSIGGIYAFLPGTRQQQQKRLEEIRKIRNLLDREDLSVLSDEKRERIERLRGKLDVDAPVSLNHLPTWTKQLFKESGPQAKEPRSGEPFAFEYVLYLTEAVNYMNGPEARRYIGQIRDVRERARERYDVDFTIGSQAYIYLSMLREIKREGPVMIGAALVLVLLLLMSTFQHPLRGLVALVPLGLGSTWLFGLMGWLSFDLDFFNVVILPVVIGIGVDDGVHFYRRYLETGPGTVASTLRWVGSAILMTSVTSGLGFGGLAITDQASLQSIGWLAVFGIGSTFLATVLAMPPLLYLAERSDWLSILVADDATSERERPSDADDA